MQLGSMVRLDPLFMLAVEWTDSHKAKLPVISLYIHGTLGAFESEAALSLCLSSRPQTFHGGILSASWVPPQTLVAIAGTRLLLSVIEQ